MKVLVTGGMGYLGRVLVNQLLKVGHDVRVLDALLYGGKQDNLPFELIEGDIRDEKVLDNSLRNVEAVIHLAAIVGDAAADLDKRLSLEINYFGARKVASACRQKGIKLIYASTCSVYGARDTILSEVSEVFPLSVYAMTKLAGEESLHKTAPDSTIFRLGTLFGLSPRMRFDLLINLFIAKVLNHEKITVFGGQQHRCFVHVLDVAKVFIAALDSKAEGLFNLGGFNYTIIEIAKKIQQKMGCEVEVFENVKDPRTYIVDSSMAISTFGIKPKHDIYFALDEISRAYEAGALTDYKSEIYDNNKSLRGRLT